MKPIEFHDVSVSFGASTVLRSVDLQIDEGELALVVGPTGSGKSTLLGAVNGLVPSFTGGTVAGRVLVGGHDTSRTRPRDLAAVVGVVGQDPLAGFVTDTVEEELAYGMEQLGLPAATMRRRVEETLDLMSIAELRGAALRELSGGQQQRVAIGSVLASHPGILVLDEPTSALDPTGAEEVLASVTRLVHDLGVTVLMAEHRIERVIHYADLIVSVDGGRVVAGPPAEVMATATVAPPVVRLGRWAGWSPLPTSVRDARRRAGELRDRLGDAPVDRATASDRSGPVGLSARSVTVRHGQLLAVDDVSLDICRGQVVALIGRNGSGKSTLLWALQGSGPRTSGSVMAVGPDGPTMGERPVGGDPARLEARERRRVVGLVPQTPADLLYLTSVAEECAQADQETGSPSGTCRALLDRIVSGIDDATHPRDLSEGQRLALVLAIQLTAQPSVVLLDEPTRGLDYDAKAGLGRVLRELADDGRSILLSTHDVEFVAEVADRVLVMAAGEVVADGPIAEVVRSSPAYAPQVAKIVGNGWITVDQVRAADGD